MREFTIYMPLPDRALNPHAKGHWRSKAKATKEARIMAVFCIGWAIEGDMPNLGKAEVSMTYDVSPDKKNKGYRARDVQNAISACKAYIDGCKDAGLIVDDSAKHLSWGKCEIVKEGKPGVTLVFRETA